MRWNRWAILAASVVAVTVGVTRDVILVWVLWFPGQAFDPIAWRDEQQVSQGVRLRMADRLLARKTLHGKTRPEVIEMLGDPTMTGGWDNWDMVYYLGWERSYFIGDFEWLAIRFGPDGRVAKCRIVRD